jgi:serine/threonine-protein kinase
MLRSPKFEVLGELGHGGMGTVYRVRHVTLDTVYAVKVLNPALGADGELATRFERESRVMARLAHRNIARVADIDTHEGVRFIVMEYVDGPSLGALLKARGGLPPTEALSIVEQVARALAYAHARGVIHRDVKPGNIIVETETGRAVVTDFGIAKVMDATELTRTGFMGTVRYSSPEQIRGEKVDGRADVYSLGLVLFETLTGSAPFADLNPTQIIARLFSPVEKPLELADSIPAPLRDLIRRASTRDRDRRIASAEAFLAEVSELQRRYASAPAVQSSPGPVPDTPWVIGADVAKASRTRPAEESRGHTPAARASVPAAPAAGMPRWVWPGAAAAVVLIGIVAAIAFRVAHEQRVAITPSDHGPASSAANAPAEPARAQPAPAVPPAPAQVATHEEEPSRAPQPAVSAAAPAALAAIAAAPAAPAAVAPAAASPAQLVAAPPRIENTAPEGRNVDLQAGSAVEFRAQAVDTDGRPLAVAWSVDGKPAGSMPVLRFESPSDERARTHTVMAEATDAAGKRASTTWRVKVAAAAAPLRIVRFTPETASVSVPAGQSRLFSIDAEVPGAPGQTKALSYEWRVDDAVQAEHGNRFELRVSEPGTHRVTASARGPEGKPVSRDWRVEIAAEAAQAPENGPGPESAAVVSSSPPDVEILDFNDAVSKDRRSLTLEGKVKNHGQSAIEHLNVVVQALDAGGNVVGEEAGVPHPQPLPPGQTASFRIRMNNDQRVQSFRVEAFPRSSSSASGDSGTRDDADPGQPGDETR